MRVKPVGRSQTSASSAPHQRDGALGSLDHRATDALIACQGAFILNGSTAAATRWTIGWTTVSAMGVAMSKTRRNSVETWGGNHGENGR
jgi:hypothetical protein